MWNDQCHTISNEPASGLRRYSNWHPQIAAPRWSRSLFFTVDTSNRLNNRGTSWNTVRLCESEIIRNPSQRSRRKRTCDSGTAITDSQCNENELQYGNIWNGYVASSNGKVMQSVLCLGPQRQTGTLWNFSGLFLEESTGVHLRGLLHSQKSSKPEHLDHLDLHNGRMA